MIPQPIADLRSELLPEYVRETFFKNKDKRSLLVQVSNPIELATQGEFRLVPAVETRVERAG